MFLENLLIFHSSVYLCQGNKGGVSVRFSLYGHMVCFLNCHLAAHMNYALQRVDEFEYILEAQDFDISDTPRVLDHKSVHLLYLEVKFMHWGLSYSR